MESKSGFELQQHTVGTPAQYRAGYAHDNERNVDHDVHDGIHTGNSADAFDMRRMGRKQELRRNFKSVSILGLAAVTMATWLALLVGSLFSLTNGGLAGTIWVYLGSWICTMTLVSSLAEMASMAPTSGGQYHWVSEFAPASQQAFLSYVVGWLAALGWQAIIAGGSFSTAALLLQLVSFNDPSYVPENWHITLLMIGVAVFAAAFNTVGARQLPMIEGVILFVGRPKRQGVRPIADGEERSISSGSLRSSLRCGRWRPRYPLARLLEASPTTADGAQSAPRALLAQSQLQALSPALMLLRILPRRLRTRAKLYPG